MIVSPVLFNSVSLDRKLSPVRWQAAPGTKRGRRPEAVAPFCSSTYVSIAATCPDSCTFKGDGCYVTEGFTANTARRLDGNARNLSGDEVIALEVEAVHRAFFRRTVPQDGARGGRDLRLHVGGDVSSSLGASMLCGAAMTWRLRGGGSVWTYTHRWREVPRERWGGAVSVLASCESPGDIEAAKAAGYAPAVTLTDDIEVRAFELGGHKVVPCPAETRGTTCVECRLCLDRDLLRLGVVIGFGLHGKGAARARRRLEVLQ